MLCNRAKNKRERERGKNREMSLRAPKSCLQISEELSAPSSSALPSQPMEMSDLQTSPQEGQSSRWSLGAQWVASGPESYPDPWAGNLAWLGQSREVADLPKQVHLHSRCNFNFISQTYVFTSGRRCHFMVSRTMQFIIFSHLSKQVTACLQNLIHCLAGLLAAL